MSPQEVVAMGYDGSAELSADDRISAAQAAGLTRHQRYNRSIKGRERAARCRKKAAQTPGSYRYCEYHGIGRAGEAKRQRDTRLRKRRFEQGLCTRCGAQRWPGRGWTQCDNCLNEKQIDRAEKAIAEYRRLLALPPDDPEYLAIVRRTFPITAVSSYPRTDGQPHEPAQHHHKRGEQR